MPLLDILWAQFYLHLALYHHEMIVYGRYHLSYCLQKNTITNCKL